MSERNERSESGTPVPVSQLDPNMRLDHVRPEDGGLRWFSPKQAPFRLEGFAWFEQDGIYRRMPKEPRLKLPEAVDALANHTAGGQIRFRTDSRKLSVRVKLDGTADMDHMPATGQCGFDCYVEQDGRAVYHSTARYNRALSEYEAILIDTQANWEEGEEAPKELRTITLYFPLYRGVREVEIGLETDAELLPPPPHADDRRVIIYGTSITQGGCANRPGMAYPNIMSRRIPLEFINLGFSGNGRGEPEVAELVADIAKPALLVLDYEANSGAVEKMAATLPSFIRICRERHPDTPILVVSRIPYARDRFYKMFVDMHEACKKFQREHVEQLRREGDTLVYFHDGSTLLGEYDVEECTVDGVHPTDLGFLRIADGLTPVVRRILVESGISV